MGYNKEGYIMVTGIKQTEYDCLPIGRKTLERKSPVVKGDFYFHPLYGTGYVTDVLGENIFTRFKIGLMTIDKDWLISHIEAGDASIEAKPRSR